MASQTEGIRLTDVVKHEEEGHYCRESRIVKDNETLSIGEICFKDGSSEMVACAAAADEVQTITFDAAMTAGELTITIVTPDGFALPVSVVWNATWSGTMGDWNTAMTAAATAWASEASVGAVMTGTATVPILTFSGVGFTDKPFDPVDVDISGTTGPTYANVAETARGHTAGGDAEAVALTAASGAGKTALFLVRGPATVDQNRLTVPSGGLAAAIVALALVGIIARPEPTEQTEGITAV